MADYGKIYWSNSFSLNSHQKASRASFWLDIQTDVYNSLTNHISLLPYNFLYPSIKFLLISSYTLSRRYRSKTSYGSFSIPSLALLISARAIRSTTLFTLFCYCDSRRYLKRWFETSTILLFWFEWLCSVF